MWKRERGVRAIRPWGKWFNPEFICKQSAAPPPQFFCSRPGAIVGVAPGTMDPLLSDQDLRPANYARYSLLKVALKL